VKILALILAFSIALQLSIPCTDNLPVSQIAVEHDTHHHSKDVQDTCTPLCSCACCGVLTITQQIPDISPALPAFSEHLSAYISNKLLQTTSLIWQPPK